MKKMRLFFGPVSAVIAVLILAAINIYVARGLYRWLALVIPGVNLKAFITIYALLAVSMIAGFLPLPSAVNAVVGRISAYWMGTFIYLLICFLAADIVVLLGRIVRIIPGPVPPDVLFFKGLAALFIALGVACYGFFNANQIRFTSYEMDLQGKSPRDGLKIALISDLHLGSLNAERNLVAIVEKVNGMEADIVCIAGDIFNDDVNTLSSPENVMGLFKSIKSAYGVYACMGNHDGGRKFDSVSGFLAGSGVRLLNDEYETIGENLIIVGRIDRSPIGGLAEMTRRDISDVLPPQDAGKTVIVMDHNPARIDEYGKETDLIVAGHTHNGQLFPMNLITNAMYAVQYGHYKKDADSPHVIVTSGAGTWGPPLRVGSNNEVVCITLS